jgi:hypothetical protein
MNCPECQIRMSCTFTVPIGKRSRFRIYRCPECRHYEETYETSTLLLPPTQEELRTLQLGIAKAKAQRYGFAAKKRLSS